MSELTERQRYWLGHLKACKAQGLSLRAYAEAEGLGLGSLYGWNRKLGPYLDPNKRSSSADTSPRFVPVELTGPSAFSADCRIDLPNGVTLHWPLTAPPEPLRHLLPVLAKTAS